MPLEGEYVPSPRDAVAEQVRLYEETGGEEGGTLRGKPCIILTSVGARSGKLRKTPLMRVTDGERYAVVASMGGAPEHPQWYRNLRANPHVVLQDGPLAKDYLAREVDGAEREEWWARAVVVWPDYDEYQARTDRAIPVLVLDPA